MAVDSGAACRLSGQIFNADTETGIPVGLGEAVVMVVGMKRGAKTDSMGRFRIDSIPSGRYVMRTRRLGFKPRQDSVVLSDFFGQKVEVGLEIDILDGCPGFMSLVKRTRKWTWKWW